MADDDIRAGSAPIRWRAHEKALAVALLLALVAAIVLTFRFVASQDAPPERVGSDASSTRGGSTAVGVRDATSSSGAPTDTASRPRSASRTRGDVRARAEIAGDGAPSPRIADRDVAPAPSAVPATPPDSVTIGRFTVFGETDDHRRQTGADRGRTLGERVAIDGDVAVATAWFQSRAADPAEAWVFERRDGAWRKTQTLLPPQYAEGFARDVGISRGRIVVVGGYALGTRGLVFRSYTREADDVWTIESETPIPFEPWGSDWTLRGDVLTGIAGNGGSVVSWKFVQGTWTPLQEAGSHLGTSAGSWITSSGDTIACFEASQGNERLAFLRRKADRLRPERLPADLPNPGAAQAGALARDGAALVTTSGYVTIYERGADGWARTLASRLPARVSGVVGFRSVAADGDLAVVAAVDPARFVLLQHRTDGWYATDARPPGKDRKDEFRFTNCASVAMSGRTVIAGTNWDYVTGGRVLFFDVTDDDLAAATLVPSDAR